MKKEKHKNRKSKGERLAWKSLGNECLDLEKRLKNVVISEPKNLSDRTVQNFLIP